MVQFLSMLKNQKTNLLAGAVLLFAQINVSAQCSTTGWTKISQGENFSIALKQDGTIWIWGKNEYGLLGNGSTATTEIKHPTQIGTDANWTDISTGRNFILATKANGDLYGWGGNYYGEQGIGHNTNLSAPTLIQQNVKAFSAGYYHTLVVKTDGTLWGAGYNDYSGLGVGTSVSSYNTFQQEASKATNWASVTGTYYNSFAIKTNGTLWSAGSNAEGQNGLGTPGSVGAQTNTFTQVGTDANWKAVVGGIYHTLGLKTNGELWSWGHNNNGRLGIGTTGSIFYTPQQVPGTTWASIGATNEASSAIKTDGSLWTWGYNQYGKLGIGTTTDVNIPTKVGTENTWKSIPVRSGENSSGGIKTVNTIWAWGYDGYWQLGNNDGTETNSNIPTQVTCTDLLGVNDVTKNNVVTLYPNPAKDILYLNAQQKISEIKIYNTAGSLIKTSTNLVDNKVNVSQLKSGVYIITINGNTEGVKFIKD